jgi:hypothetical protein
VAVGRTRTTNKHLPPSWTSVIWRERGNARGANIRQQGVLLDTPYRFISAPGRNRTGDLALRRHSLYPLSYRGRKKEAGDGQPASMVGGGEGDRTLDLRIANATLSQLSYSPEKGEEY